jgi:hypothetical protein
VWRRSISSSSSASTCRAACSGRRLSGVFASSLAAASCQTAAAASAWWWRLGATWRGWPHPGWGVVSRRSAAPRSPCRAAASRSVQGVWRGAVTGIQCDWLLVANWSLAARGLRYPLHANATVTTAAASATLSDSMDAVALLVLQRRPCLARTALMFVADWFVCFLRINIYLVVDCGKLDHVVALVVLVLCSTALHLQLGPLSALGPGEGAQLMW